MVTKSWIIAASDFPVEKHESTGPSSKRPRLDAAEAKAMSAKQYMDELIVPTLLKGLSVCNKQASIKLLCTKQYTFGGRIYSYSGPSISPIKFRYNL